VWGGIDGFIQHCVTGVSVFSGRNFFEMLCFFWQFLGRPALALQYQVPKLGTAVRSRMMDAVRPHAQWNVCSPVEIVISDIRVSGRPG